MRLRTVLLLAAVVAVAAPARRAEPAKQARYQRTLETYSVPDVTLVNQEGRRIRLRELVDSGKPVMLDFIYGTCTTICPVLSAGYSHFQKKMGDAAAERATLLSISIDPDHDTPLVMNEYLRRYGARPGWEFLTGTPGDVVRVMRAFDAYVDNKMNHYPLTILRAPGADRWVRIYGLIGGRDLLEEYRRLVAD